MKDYLSKVKLFSDKSEDIAENYKLLLCGETKAGKTYFAGTAPNPFFIDTDGSLNGLPVEKRNIPVLSLRVDEADGRSWTLSVNGEKSEFKPLTIIDNTLRELKANDCKINDYEVKTIVFDGLTTLAKLIMYESMVDSRIGRTERISDGFRDPTKQKATFDEYGTLEAKLDLLFTKIDDLGLNIVATAGLKMDKDELTGSMRWFPNILGGFRHDVGHRFDGVAILTTEKMKHYMNIGEYEKFRGGFRNWQGPEKIKNPTWNKIVENIR